MNPTTRRNSASASGLSARRTSLTRVDSRAPITTLTGCIVLGTLLFLLLGRFSLRWVPLPESLLAAPVGQIEITDRQGVPLRTVRIQDRPFGRPATYAEIPRALVQATLAAEDKRFWQHPGVDWRGSLRAAWGLVRNRRVISGGSTITQQLIKLAQPRPRTFRTKFIEAVQALRLEQIWTKQRILTEDRNRLDYGNLNTGCAAAAEFYWAKPLHDLSSAECAFLAGLPQAPARLNPLRHFERARKRQQWVLRRMFETGLLAWDEFDRAKAERPRLAIPQRAFAAPHFVDLLLQHAEQWTPKRASAAPAAIRTTLDLYLNRFVEQCLRQQIDCLHSRHVGNAAAVVLDNRSGGVWALVGSEDYSAARSGQVNGAWAPRSAGSTFKPFTYAIAFEQGATAASIVADVPTDFTTATGLFSPVNYDHRCHGPMRYRLALANSLNIAAVKVLASIGGPGALQERLQACGLTTLTRAPEHYGLGLTIGNAEARLLELANAYATLARLGEFRPYRLIEQLEVGSAPGQSCARRVFDPGASFLIADILSDNDARTLAFGAESNLRFEFPVACKTGTSSDFRDNWAFGYTPEFTVGVWVGNFDGSPMGEISGVTGAAPILHGIFEHLHQRYGTTWYETPSSIVARAIDPMTGKCRRDSNPGSSSDQKWTTRANSESAARRPSVFEKFIVGHLAPDEAPGDFDGRGRLRLSAEYQPWSGTSDNWLAESAIVDDRITSFRIAFPLPATKFLLDPDLPDSGQRVHLRVDGPSKPEWHCDTLQIRDDEGETTAFLRPGQHRLSARDPGTGQTRETWILVLER